MNTTRIDLANIALMLISCAAAFVIPFELFLFSYAVLGPLHYLTEITWLHKRDYFANGKFDYVWLILLCAVLFILNFVFTDHPTVANFMIYLAFVSALGFVMFKDWLWKIGFIGIGAFLGGLIASTQSFFFLFAVFLPTLIHVFVFTGLFILLGALKNRSITGVISLVVFIACAVSFFIFYPQFTFYKISDYAQKTLVESGFAMVNQSFVHIFNLGTTTRETVFASNIGFGIMRFIAFAYTYHYLNWFSKTSVIKWHQVPKKWLITTIALWVASVGLYAYNYKTGLIALYFLSMLHVFLEFPLNYRSVIGIGEEFGTLTGLRKQPVPVATKTTATSKKGKTTPVR
ncbi:MAG TPA: hypothetical protein VK154_09750 [Chitinophagales bacterium]|nr:hypothetical protein [Chitinophagales bacterium]